MSQSAGPPDTWPATTPPAHPGPGFDSYVEDHAYEADDGLAEYSQDQYATASEDGDQTAPKADPIGTASVDIVQAVTAPSSDALFRALINHLSPAIALAMDRDGVTAEEPAASAPADLIARRLRRYLLNGIGSSGALRDLVARIAKPQTAEAAAPALAALLARYLLRAAPSGDGAAMFLAGALNAIRVLLAEHGPDSLSVLPVLASHAARWVATRPPETVVAALPKYALRLARAAKSRRPTSTAMPTTNRRAAIPQERRWGSGQPRRFVLHGPVEITILER